MKALGQGSVAKYIIQAKIACEAKRLGKRVITVRVWETERLQVMKQITLKHECVPRYRHYLSEGQINESGGCAGRQLLVVWVVQGESCLVEA